MINPKNNNNNMNNISKNDMENKIAEIWDAITHHYFVLKKDDLIIHKGSKVISMDVRTIIEWLISTHWMESNRTSEEWMDALKQYQWDKNRLPFATFSGGKDTIIGYKYARSSDDIHLGNTTPYIHHVANQFVVDNDIYGLFFFTEKRLLLPYMTYGDILVKIKITDDIYNDMYVKKYSTLQGNEYACMQYFVSDIMDLRKKDTIDFILSETHTITPLYRANAINHLKIIGADESVISLIRQFKPCV